MFQYEDYRQFLRDHYQFKKAKSQAYSFRFFARKAGLRSPNYYKLVMDGHRNLTHRHLRKFSRGLGLTQREEVYFENLVFWNQAKDPAEKQFFERNLELARAEDDRVLLSKDQYEVFSKWYPLAIKELLLLQDFPHSPRDIAARFDHRFTPVQAREALSLLQRLGLVEADQESKRFKVVKQSMQTPDLASSEAIISFHREMADMVKEALSHQSSTQRCLSSLTVAVRKQDLPEAFRRIHQFRNQMDAFFVRGKPYDSVYQLNIHLFRLDCDVR